MHTYIFIYRNRERTKSFAVYLKLTQYCKLTIVQLKKRSSNARWKH